MLDISKIEARKLDLYPTSLHLPSFLQAIVEIIRIRAEQNNIDFIYQPDPQLPESVEADEKRLRQVLINLLGNAVKFTDKGQVILKVETDPLSNNNISRIKFSVEDTGVGISEEDIKKIFQPFDH